MSSRLPPAEVHVTYSQQYRRCSKQGCALCRDGGKGHGPYWFAYWREDGKVHSRYLGKQAPVGAEQPQEQRATSPAARQVQAPAPVPVPAPRADVPPWLRVRTLGGLEVWRDGQLVPATSWRRRKVTGLFTCLLSAPGCRLPREALCEALWPDAEPEAATRNLHATVHLLRKALDSRGMPASVVQLAGEMVTLEPGREAPEEAWLDATTFSRAAKKALAARDRAACRDALALYSGDFLPDEPYTDWVVPRREELRAQHLALLLHLAILDGAAGDHAEAERCYNSILARDPCHEDAAAALMGLLAAQGRRAEALRVYQALATALENDLGLTPSDEIEALRGRVQAQEAAPVAADQPPRHPLPPQIGNLPAPLTSFVGRTWEEQEIAGLLARSPAAGGSRLLTLVGVGGSGKTRLALAVAAGLRDAFPDGAWLVELAALTEGGQVPDAVTRALGVREEPGCSVPATLGAFLRPRRLLLVLDNCEHLIEPCADLAASLLRDCPGLSILATSRTPLAILGEQVWRVPPLATPPAEPLPDLDALPRYEAVQLLVDRVRASKADFALTETNAGAIARICRQLDGLPLAIELAAARLATLPIGVVTARLDDCFALLIGGNRAALPRQQTLQATMDWSYELLSAPERTLLQRLSIFSGGCTLEAAEAVCADAAAQAGEVPDLLAGLVAQSLVQLSDRHTQPRYTLLETVRQYASARLAEGGEGTAVQERHRDWFLAQAERMRAGLATPNRDRWLNQLDDDLDNVRAALAWCADRADEGATFLRFVEALLFFWLLRGHPSEGRYWIQTALRHGASAPALQRAKALNALGALANEQGEGRQALEYYEESLDLFREAGDTRGVASVLVNQGNVAKYQGDFALARERYEEGSRLLRAIDDKGTLSVVLNNLGALHLDLGETRPAMDLLEESLSLKRAMGNPKGIVPTLGNVAEVARQLGELDRAVALYDEYLDLARALGDKASIALAFYNLGLIADTQGRHARAVGLFGDSLALQQELGNKRHIASCLEGVAAMAGRLGDPATGCRLLGAAEALREVIGTPVAPSDRSAYHDATSRLRSQLGEEAAARAWAAGRTMSVDRAVSTAIALAQAVGQQEDCSTPRSLA